MADPRSVVTTIAVVAALACGGWAVYATKHKAAGNGGQGFAQQGQAQGAAGAGRRPDGAAQSGQARQGGGQGAGQGAGQGRQGGGQGQGQGPISVVTAAARMANIDVGIEAIGTAVSNEAVSITAKVSNIVTAIHFKDGQNVKAGDVLVEMDHAQVTAELASAQADYANSVSLFNRSKELAAMQSLSKAQFEQLETNMKSNEAKVAAIRARLSDTYIRAPFGGRVGLRRISLGALINPGTVITTLDDLSTLKVDFAVPDVLMAELGRAQTVVARTAAYPGRKFSGKVVSIDSRVDANSRSVTVRALLPNQDGALKPGMFLTVSMDREQRKALVIPEEALVPEQARQFVYVVIAGDKVSKREVRIGRRQPGEVEVADGLANGDRVVVEGTLKLREGSSITERIQAAPVARPVAAPAKAAAT
ncbi:MAG: efflux RND transporter periplasmic adaptor subunit [Proteobacteria bacterium]|nr:efflux RND transporter periplasmic adaptor subunit [Pseudomonadota bacterium]